MEYSFGVERNFGSKYFGMIPVRCEADAELNSLASDFILSAMVLYVNAIKGRNEDRGSVPLKNSGKLSASFIQEFFEGCNALMALPETKKQLRDEFLATGKPPNEKIIALQRGVLNWLGADADFGVSCLNTLSKDYPDDRLQHSYTHSLSHARIE